MVERVAIIIRIRTQGQLITCSKSTRAGLGSLQLGRPHLHLKWLGKWTQDLPYKTTHLSLKMAIGEKEARQRELAKEQNSLKPEV